MTYHAGQECKLHRRVPSTMEARQMDRALRLFVPVVGLMLALLVALVGGVGMLLQWNPKDLPHLFFGLFLTGCVLFVIVLGVVHERVSGLRTDHGAQVSGYIAHILPPPWSQSGSALCEALRVREVGLDDVEAYERLKLCGRNVVELAPVPGYWNFFWKEIHEPTQLLLISVGLLYVMVGSPEEGATAFVVICLMAAAEVWTEWRAKKALSKLELSAPLTALVKREGVYKTVNCSELVQGDIVFLSAGMEVGADIRLLHSQSVEVDESKISGESTPVFKNPECLLPADSSIFDWKNIVLAGSYVRRGTGTGVVYETGTRTYLGHVLSLAGVKKGKKTKLQKQLKHLAWALSLVALVASLFGSLLGMLKHMMWKDVLLSALSLAFATIPEELPILIAAVLAVGCQTLSSANVYVKNLRAAENLGYVNVILTDKTGTLTANQLVLKKILTVGLGTQETASETSNPVEETCHDSLSVQKLLAAWGFMVDSDPLEDLPDLPVLGEELRMHLKGKDADTCFGMDFGAFAIDLSSVDVFDQAVLRALGKCKNSKHHAVELGLLSLHDVNIHLQGLWEQKRCYDLIAHIPFDSRWKFAAKTFGGKSISRRNTQETVPASFPESRVIVKGAPEFLIQHCGKAFDRGSVVNMHTVKKQLQKQVADAASQGLRLVAYASRTLSVDDHLEGKVDESEHPMFLKGCTFLGSLAFEDPARQGVVDAIAQCYTAGVRVVMVTGDHVETARAVAHHLGILESGASGCGAVSCAEEAVSTMNTEGLLDLTTRVNVFARATPDDKLAILKALQASSYCVMAAGDGMNDAPILCQADVGIAMGKGTDVARKAASIVVLDDNFTVMPFALAEGRRLLDNLRKAIAFYLGAKLGLLFLFIAGTIWQSFPLQAIHIIVLELFMDLGASTSFVVEPADQDVMTRQPLKHSAPFFDTPLISGVLASAASMTASVFGSFSLGVHAGKETAQTCAFMSWLLAHVMLALNMRTSRLPVTKTGWLTNRGMCIWFVAVVAFAILASTQIVLRDHLQLVRLPTRIWVPLVVVCILGTFWIEATKVLLHRFEVGVGDYVRVSSQKVALLKHEANVDSDVLLGAERVDNVV